MSGVLPGPAVSPVPPPLGPGRGRVSRFPGPTGVGVTGSLGRHRPTRLRRNISPETSVGQTPTVLPPTWKDPPGRRVHSGPARPALDSQSELFTLRRGRESGSLYSHWSLFSVRSTRTLPLWGLQVRPTGHNPPPRTAPPTLTRRKPLPPSTAPAVRPPSGLTAVLFLRGPTDSRRQGPPEPECETVRALGTRYLNSESPVRYSLSSVGTSPSHRPPFIPKSL